MLFFPIFQKLLIIYLNILVGFIAGKALKISSTDIAKIIFYIATPFVAFQGILKVELEEEILLLPLIIFIIACFMASIFYLITRRLYSDFSKNILSFTAGNGNLGFVGLPLVTLVTNNNNYMIGTYITAMLGITIYENTLGFIIASKGDTTSNTIGCFKRLLKLPILYAFALGCILNINGINFYNLPDNIIEYLHIMQGCYLTLGILIIGIALSQIETLSFDFKFTGMAFLAKFVCWPLIMKTLVTLDKLIFNIYDADIHKILLMLSIAPIATNTVTLATILKIHPEKAATTVLLGACFALVYMPLMIQYFV
ncbi:AEC family transporter [Rickettsiales endosymbiont of Stachyamoeba lipophora]|uniref:AEC family transporter n=1 Tax=Rickettsiales endosymbiont of Stachyamoeba lipophora TaxID=2486578 RepID=UPI000F64A26E|nr:AEC family transporter [Rickettsiales endosymbiont of Stachyamoeba lipophora]AZL15851.1 hypothetical protein EF513_04745 [Rickettsiales endosymbiont of Stachyamoeba lipophora]